MFKKVAAEHDIHRTIAQSPRLADILRNYGNFFVCRLYRGRIEIDSVFFFRLDVIDKFAVAGAEIQDGTVRFNPLLKEGSQHLPDQASAAFKTGEAIGIRCLQIAAESKFISLAPCNL